MKNEDKIMGSILVLVLCIVTYLGLAFVAQIFISRHRRRRQS